MILAISGSPRKDRMIHNTLKEILRGCKEPYEIITLSGKRINGCIACTMCANDNICKVKDDWSLIAEKMLKADIIIFGAPNYYNTLNALSHACLERTFAFRHRSAFLLKEKLGITVSTYREGVNSDNVQSMIEKFMKSNQMNIVGHVACHEYSQCYTCGYGYDCEAGSVVRCHGVLKSIQYYDLPNEVESQQDTLNEIKKIKEVLKKRGIEYEK